MKPALLPDSAARQPHTPCFARLRFSCRALWLIAAAVMTSLATPVAQAQANKIFVASFGNDANDGSRGSPKRNFQAAHDAVAIGGQLVVLDTAGYGALSITKSLAITVPPGVNGFVTVTGSSTAITINVAGGVVSLRGLIIEGPQPGGVAGGYGVNALAVGQLNIDDCVVRNLATGIRINVTSGILLVRGGSVRYTGDGIRVDEPASGFPYASISDCTVEFNSNGVVAASGTGSITAVVTDCRLNRNANAINRTSPGTVVVNNCRITGNSNAFVSNGGAGGTYSYGNNALFSNTANFTFTATLNLQ